MLKLSEEIQFLMFPCRAYIANRFTDKLTKITDKIYCCRSGSAADTQAIADIVNYHLEFHEYSFFFTLFVSLHLT